MPRQLTGRPVIAGTAEGKALVSDEPLSFWGGISPETGEVIDRRHGLSGESVTGKVFVFPGGKGSSTGSAVMLECLRNGTAPAAVINLRTSPILALGVIVADELYGASVPMVVLPEEAFNFIKTGDHLTISPEGVVTVGDAS